MNKRMAKYISYDKMLYFMQKIKVLFALKTEIPTKMSELANDSNFAAKTDIPTKLSQLTNDTGFSDGVTDYNDLTNKPTKLSQFSNDKDYISLSKAEQLISEAGHLKRIVVSALPPVGSAEDNVIYLVPKSGKSGDVYDEYMLINGAFERIGNSETDLDGYIKTTDLEEVTNADIDTIVAS